MIPLAVLAGGLFLIYNGKNKTLEKEQRTITGETQNPNSYDKGDTQMTAVEIRQQMQDVKYVRGTPQKVSTLMEGEKHVDWLRRYNRQVRNTRTQDDTQNLEDQIDGAPQINPIGVQKGIDGQLNTKYRPPLLPIEPYNTLDKFIKN